MHNQEFVYAGRGVTTDWAGNRGRGSNCCWLPHRRPKLRRRRRQPRRPPQRRIRHRRALPRPRHNDSRRRNRRRDIRRNSPRSGSRRHRRRRCGRQSCRRPQYDRRSCHRRRCDRWWRLRARSGRRSCRRRRGRGCDRQQHAQRNNDRTPHFLPPFDFAAGGNGNGFNATCVASAGGWNTNSASVGWILKSQSENSAMKYGWPGSAR